MSEPQSRFGWLGAAVVGIGSLFSGAAVMYISPLVDKAVKPARPIANFRVDRDGLTVRFENLCPTAASGWWDFGDGSPLVPLSSDSPVVSHTYPRAGEYAAKLLVHNLLGEENERTVSIKLDDLPSASEPPQIVSLEAVPLSPGSYAPASYRLISSVKNAQVCVWDLGDDRPLEVVTDTNTMAPVVTFPRSGGYIVKLAAVNGSKYDERTEIITVMEPPQGALKAVISVVDRGVRRETRNQNVTFGVPYPPENKGNSFSFDREILAPTGYRIVDVKVASDPKASGLLGDKSMVSLDSARLGFKSARDLRLSIPKERQAIQLRGELVRSGNKQETLPSLVLPLVLILERETNLERPPIHVAASLLVPMDGTVQSETVRLPPLPSNWSASTRKIQIEIQDGSKVLWKGSEIPTTATVMVGRRKMQVTITRVGEQVRIDLRDPAGRTVSTSGAP